MMNNVEKKVIKTLRLLITNKCDLSCNYCCAEGHNSQFNHLNADNIEMLISVFNQLLSIKRIKLTGGEPLYFSGIDNVINSIYKLKDETQIVSIVTNGINTEQIISLMKHRDIDLTISLPSLDINTFHQLTNNGDKLKNVIESINILDSANFSYKINCVLVDGITNTQFNVSRLIERFANKHNVKLRFLELSVNDVNRKKLLNLEYKTTLTLFQEFMKNLAFSPCLETDIRESIIYAKDGMRIKYIKYFCENNCISCPNEKTSLWVSCDGYFTSCSYDVNKSIQFSKFTYNEVYQNICNNLNKF